jgi:1-acyl-sn-glycerol-3-phosphate acyltransferase
MNEQSEILPAPAPGHLPDINALIAVIRSIVGEVHPKWKHIHFTPHTLLDRELGLDSIARMELRDRIERMFNISLDEKDAVCAYTPHDLMQAIIAQSGNGQTVNTASAETKNSFQPDASALLSVGIGDPIRGSALRRQPQGILTDWLYGIHAWLVVLVMGLPVWLLMIITPGRRWRRRIARTSARLLFKCTFTPFTVTGHEQLDAEKPAIVVANHTSYLDGFILIAALDIPIRFIAKGELSRILPVRLILQRFGVEFVDRFNAHRSAMSVRRIANKARNGHSLVFFPEGTFISFAGLQPFRMGAFVAAAHSGASVVPVAIRGARKVLGSGNWLPRRTPIEVIIRPPITPSGASWQDAQQMRDIARREISAHCGEPDLVENSGAGAAVQS